MDFSSVFFSDVPDLPDVELIAGHVCALGERQKCRQVIRILQTAPILSPTFPNIGLNKIQNTTNTITKTNTSNGRSPSVPPRLKGDIYVEFRGAVMCFSSEQGNLPRMSKLCHNSVKGSQ